MDPLANIREQRALVANIRYLWKRYDETRSPVDREAAITASLELVELVEALDTWRRNGGFDPYQTPAR